MRKFVANNKRPDPSEIEVSVFGKGVGESTVLHLQDDHWIIVDSFVDPDTKKPISLEYLDYIGVSYDKVKKIIVTHWDWDHIAGLYDLVKKCSSAKVFFPLAFQEEVFTKFICAYNSKSANDNIEGSFKTKEIFRSFLYLVNNDIEYDFLHNDKLISQLNNNDQVFALSPSKKEIEEFLKYIASKIPSINSDRIDAVDRDANRISSVMWVNMEIANILLGADMEYSESSDIGWKNIINLECIKNAKSKCEVYKVSHHGGKSGDDEVIWKELLDKNPISIVSPYSRTPLPSKIDVMRLIKQTINGYITFSPYKKEKTLGRDPVVNKKIRNNKVRKLRQISEKIGQVRVRKKASETEWNIELSKTAMSLDNLRKTYYWSNS
jgi:beta-lactamase superfamily II metal-dependent hydrolase